MAKTVSAEELQLRKRARRRLIGAVALVTIVAVFLPMVLDHEPKQAKQDINIQIPSSDSGTFISKIVPVIPGTPAAKSTAKPGLEAPIKAHPPAKPDLAKTTPPAPKAADSTPPPYDTEASLPKKSVQAQPAPKPAARSDAASPATQGKSGFVVQVAALNDADKAKQMQERIAAAGIKSYTEVVPTAKGSVTRVRAGPFASREEAEKIRDQLKGLGLSGNLLPK